MALSFLPKSGRLWIAHRYRAWKESRNARTCDVMVLSRAKSGRTWLRAMLSRLYQQHYGLDEAQLIEFDNFHRQQAAVPTIFFTHGHYLSDRFRAPEWLQGFAPRKLLFLVRHPCDVAVSEYFQSTKRASSHKVELHGVDRDAAMFDFVMSERMGVPAVVDYLNTWGPLVEAYEHGTFVRYEDIRSRPVELLLSIVEFLDAPFSKEEVEGAVEFAAFENLKELERKDFFKNSRLRPRDPNDADSFKVRRGKVGGYVDYFDDGQLAAMDELVRTRLSPVFGYGASRGVSSGATPS